jgi:hypothetical protein
MVDTATDMGVIRQITGHSHLTFSAGRKFLADILPRVSVLDSLLHDTDLLRFYGLRVKSFISRGFLYTWETRGTLKMFEKQFADELNCFTCRMYLSAQSVILSAIAHMRIMCDELDRKLTLLSKGMSH